MKKLSIYVSLFGLLAFAGCTNNDNVLNDNPQETPDAVEEASGYLSVNIVAPKSLGSRATTENDYEYGDDTENAVELVRLFFFYEDGTAAPVKKNPDKSNDSKAVYNSWYDYAPTTDEQEKGGGFEAGTIEKIVHATAVLNGPEGADDPDYVIAILNPSQAILDLCENADNIPVTMKALRDVVSDFQSGLTVENKFVMSNSVYMDTVEAGADEPAGVDDDDDDNAESSAQGSQTAKSAIDYAVVKGHIYKSLDAALNNPVRIYVERIVARLDLFIDATKPDITPVEGKDNTYDTGEKWNDGEKIYVKLLGWTITSTPKKSRLLKKIDTTWKDDLFGDKDEPWNIAQFHRSFWAINPEGDDYLKGSDKVTALPDETTDYYYYSYNEIKDALGLTEKAYMQENAANPEDNDEVAGDNMTIRDKYESKVIVAGQLVDKDDKPVTIAEYGFKYYKEEDLRTYFASQLGFYSDKNDPTGSKMKKEDLTYVTQAKYLGEAGVEVPGGYYAYIVLSDTAAKNWYLGDSETAFDSDYVNEYIKNSLDNRILLWDEGQTYYFFTIRHLGNIKPQTEVDEETGEVTGVIPAGPGFYGVVRNHIYKANVTKLLGLGTPVVDPDEPIYPEEIDRDGHIIAAEINILQWRIVSQDYEFSW